MRFYGCFAVAMLASMAHQAAWAVDSSTATLSDREAIQAYYDPHAVQSIRLTIADDDQRRMFAALPKRIYVPATFQWRDTIRKKVAVRFKGNSSSHPRQTHKRSFLVRFDEYDKQQRFFGLRRVSFDNGIQFGSLFSESLITEILRDQGLPVQRANFAKVYVNEEFQGVYVNVERIDESFVARNFSGGGALFKVDEGGPGANFQFLGDDPSAYAKAFEPKNDLAKQNAHQRQLVALVRACNTASSEAPPLDAMLDLDRFLRVAAVMLFSGAFDQLTGWNPHNYYLFHDNQRNRWHYLPWDLDVGFSETAFGRIRVLDDWHAAWPVPLSAQPNPLMERIVSDPQLLARYRKLAAEILEEYFQPERLVRVLEAKYQLVKEDLARDPFPDRRATNPDDRGYDEIVESMTEFIQRRYASAKSQLENPGARPVRKQLGHPGGMPPQLAAKVMRIQRVARQREQELRAIHRIMQQVGPLVEQQKFDEAEKVLDQVLDVAGD